MGADCAIIMHQFVVTQLSRNPIRLIQGEPLERVRNALTVPYDVDLFDHGR